MRYGKARLAGAALALAALACGCAVTPAALQQRMADALAQTPCTQQTAQMEMTLHVVDAGVEAEVGLTLDSTTWYQYSSAAAPDAAHMQMTANITAMGIHMPVEVEIYTLNEGDTVKVYTHTEDGWSYAEAPAGQGAPTGLGVDLGQLALDNTVTAWGDRDAYCLTGTVPGTAIAALLDSLLDGMQGAAEMPNIDLPGMDDPGQGTAGTPDWGALTLDVSCYIDPYTCLPVAEEGTLHGLDALLGSLPGGTAGAVTADALHYTVAYDSYEPGVRIALPEEAAAAGDDAPYAPEFGGDDPANGDGTYTIYEGSSAVTVRCPDGYTGPYEPGYDYVDFYSEALDRLVEYQMWTGTDLEEYFIELADEESHYYGNAQMLPVEHVDGPDGGYTRYGFTGDGSAYQETILYAWRVTYDDGLTQNALLLTISDGGDLMDTTLSYAEVDALMALATPAEAAGPDGSYTLRAGGATATVTPPQGFTVTDTARDSVTFLDGDDLLVDFSLQQGSEEELYDIVFNNIDAVLVPEYLPRRTGAGVHGDETRYGFTGPTEEGYRRTMLFVWRPVPGRRDTWLLVILDDGGYTRDAALTDALVDELVALATLPGEGAAAFDPGTGTAA